MIAHLEAKHYYKFWTRESIKAAMKVCKFRDPNEIKFPPRGHGMSGIEYLEYYFSRDPQLLPPENLKFPWPLAIALTIQTSLRECNWIWRRLEKGERIVTYSKYVKYETSMSVIQAPFPIISAHVNANKSSCSADPLLCS